MLFIHIADVHLGAEPDKGFPWSEQRGRELWQTFRRLIRRCGEEQADLLLIAGDLFHRQPLIRELREVSYLFQKLTRTQVVLIVGNHDYLRQDSNYIGFEWPENVVCLDSRDCEKVEFPELDVTVYGFSYHAKEILEPLYDDLRPDPGPGCNILLAHGGDDRHIPIDRRKLANSGFDYIALGHIHKPQVLARNRMAYAGALEPIDCNDIGSHGYILGDWENGVLETEFVPFASRSYVNLELESRVGMTELGMQEQLEAAIERYGREQIYRVTLQGYRNPDLRYRTEDWTGLGNILEIRDETVPNYDFEELLREHQEDAAGRFISKLWEPGQESGSIRQKALYAGLRALLDPN